MALGCCNSFKKCSDAGSCLFEIGYENIADIEFEECLYKENLDKGLNFYTEYNENNERKKEEYEKRTSGKESSKIVSINTELKKNITKTDVNSTKTYLKIHERLFMLGERGYGGWTRDLKEKDKEHIIKILENKNISCFNSVVDAMAKSDELLENERCNCKVIIKLDKKEYNLQNYNSRAVKRETAKSIKNYLEERGFNAEIEMLEGFAGRRILREADNIKPIKTLNKKETKPELEQLSMFGT